MTPAACMTLSWDDGHPLDMRVADLMLRHGLRGTFYVPRAAERGTMIEAQIRELSDVFDIGAHTLGHVVLTRTCDRQAYLEIAGAKHWIEDVTGRPCSLFCPPGGRYAKRHLRMIERAGYRAIRTVELLSLDWPRRDGALLAMPTSIQAWPHDARSYVQNALKRGALRNLWRYVTHGRAVDWPALSRLLVAETALCGGVFHLWAHSWEIEEAGAWRRLDDVLRFLGEQREAMPALTNAEVCSLISPQEAACPPGATSRDLAALTTRP
jgi:hypothetical protein